MHSVDYYRYDIFTDGTYINTSQANNAASWVNVQMSGSIRTNRCACHRNLKRRFWPKQMKSEEGNVKCVKFMNSLQHQSAG